MTTIKFITESGAMYLLTSGDDRATLTRLAEHSIEDHAGALLLDVMLDQTEIEGSFILPTVGRPFKARVLGDLLTTSTVKFIL